MAQEIGDRPRFSRRRVTLCSLALLVPLALMTALPASALDLQGHRGARGLLPENTLPAFLRALELGMTTLELDCGITKDGVVVISHDRALNPEIVRDASGRWLEGPGPALRELTYESLQKYDVGRLKPGTDYARRFPRQQPVDGTRIPRLADLFELVRARGDAKVRFNIETKLSPLAPGETMPPAAFARAVLEVVRTFGVASRVTIQSFDWRTLALAQKAAPRIPTVYLTAAGTSPHNIAPASPWMAGHDLTAHGGSVPRTIKAAGGAIWSPYHGDLTEAAVREAQALGLKVVVWTVNAESDMRRLIAWGVDGIISDYPDVLMDVVRRVR